MRKQKRRSTHVCRYDAECPIGLNRVEYFRLAGEPARLVAFRMGNCATEMHRAVRSNAYELPLPSKLGRGLWTVEI